MPRHRQTLKNGILVGRGIKMTAREEAVHEILFPRRVLNNRYPKRVVEAQITNLASSLSDFLATGSSTGDAFDLFDLVDCKDIVASGVLRTCFANQRDENGPLAMCMNATSSTPFCKCGEEERCTG